MSATLPAYDYWRRLAALRVEDIACLLAGFNPRARTDVVDRDGCPRDLDDEIRLITSAVRAGELQLGPSEPVSSLSPASSVLRRSLVPWLRANHHESVAAGLCDESEPPVEDPELDRSPSNVLMPQENCPEIPGKIPMTAASRIAVEAAWELESESGRQATTREVFELMARWAESGEKHADILDGYNREDCSIAWFTMGSNKKKFTLPACSNALRRWHQSRR